MRTSCAPPPPSTPRRTDGCTWPGWTGARQIGYRCMLLDTLPVLEDAVRLYRQLGFYEIPCYNDSPVESTLFFQLDL